MTEDIELTRKILELYADEDKWPSSIGEAELREAFPDVHTNVLTAHIVWAQDSGMFKGKAYEIYRHMGGVEYIIGAPDGLSKEGSDYVKYARTSLWDKAKERAKEKSVPLTTQLLAKILPQLAEAGLP